MAGKYTFTMIKPNAVRDGHTGEIIKMINDAGFRIVAMKMTKLSIAAATKFYEIHTGKPFFGKLIDFMTSGPIVAMVLEKDNAIEDFRKLIGNTDPSKAANGTIRQRFGLDVKENAIHGADSDDNARQEAYFHFSSSDMYDYFGVPIMM